VNVSLVRRITAAISGLAFLSLTACGGGGGSSSSPSPTPTPGGSGTTAAYTCPTSDSVASVARSANAVATESVRRMPPLSSRLSKPATTLLAVTYDRTIATTSAASIAARENAAGATSARTLDFPHVGLTTHILTVPAAKSATIEAALRAQTGVKSVAATGYARRISTVSAAYYPNDPYFNGFANGNGTYHTPPYDESQTVAGQWDMHATKLEYAFAYSQANNGSNITNANALGSASIKIAIIDTGEDATHPELASKIAYQKCFITSTSGAQSSSSYASDPMGHGTDVAGIAAAATNNNLGFTGAGGNTEIYGYRVFPTPDDSCASEMNQDDQCEASSADITSAIVDATAQHVDVISMSLGGGACTAGADPDPVEGAAVQDAIAAGIIVVAAAGNDSSSPLEAPACDTGVIAVGASALGDGFANGSGSTVGTSNSPAEYVASYSNWGGAAAPKSASAWGIVAPGGDPAGDMDGDDLHWIENIWTSKPYDAMFDGECGNDFPNGTQTTNPDCRVLIAGTSQATPHVAGAAALILSVNSAYKSATAMKTLLCTTADDIGAAHEGCGRINIYRAMAKALNDPNLPT
jgi:subtilisin family serine protease